MKIPESRAAVQRYRVREDDLGWYPDMPDEPVPVHALLFDPDELRYRRRHWLDNPTHEVMYLESGYESEEAACGRQMRVVFPMSFDTDEDDACPQCLDMAQLWVTDREEYDRRVRERHDRWQRQDEERRELEEYRRRHM